MKEGMGRCKRDTQGQGSIALIMGKQEEEEWQLGDNQVKYSKPGQSKSEVV